ncbi:MAG: hypothetical protein ACI9DO_000300 [Reinekea sp.]|jgi:hypothetical protein
MAWLNVSGQGLKRWGSGKSVLGYGLRASGKGKTDKPVSYTLSAQFFLILLKADSFRRIF